MVLLCIIGKMIQWNQSCKENLRKLPINVLEC